jgi:predicted peroxiredoxin
MSKKALILIRSDPRQSHRPCEGVRIALGLAASGHQVELVFTEEAPRILEDDIEDLVDGELAMRYLTTLKDFISVFYIDDAGAGEIDLSDSKHQTQLLSKEEISSKIAGSEWFVRF